MTKATIQSVRQTDRAGLFTSSKLRLYCLRLSDSVLIVGNGGQKSTRTYEEDSELNGYVIQLQKLDDLLKMAEAKGEITIEGNYISGIDNINYEI